MSESIRSRGVGRQSRRDFLKASSAVAASAMVGSLAVGRAAHAAGSDILKVGLIGCGGRGSGAAGNALNADKNARLVAMADLFQDKVLSSREALKKVKGEQVAVDDEHCFVGFDAYRKVIDSADVVLVACASRFHPQYMKAAVEAGKHVFVEKPHAVDPPGVQVVKESCELARKKGTSVLSGLCWRYHTTVQETMKRVHDGAIGDIVAIQETYMRSPYRLVERKPDESEIEYQFRNWYHFNWLSGDDILQSLIHSMDKGCWTMQDQPPVSAYGHGGRASSIGTVYGDVFDHHFVMYEYANGVRLYGVGRAQAGCYNEVSDVVLGTKGRADLQKGVIQGQTNWKYDGPTCNMYDNEHLALFQAIRSGKPLNNGDYMVNSTMQIILGQMVCRSGKQLTWEQAVNSKHQLGPEKIDFKMDPPVRPDSNGIYPVEVPGLTQLT